MNLITAGGNYGWRNKEGTFDFDPTAPGTGPFIDPVVEYAHPNTELDLPAIGISVTGGHVYRGDAIPELQGRYVFADWSRSFGSPGGTLLGLEEIAPGEFSLVVPEVVGGNPIDGYIAAFGEDQDGELYVATKTTLAPSATDPDTGEPTGAIWRLTSGADGGETVTRTFAAAKDNTMFSEDSSRSNGSGPGLFAGRTAVGGIRRALMQFDLAGELPAGASVDSATLTLEVNMVPLGAANVGMSLHRLETDWGEAGSNAGSFNDGMGAPAEEGDATWVANFFGIETWSSQGGDFEATASSTTMVQGTGSYTWSGAGLVADVQGFVGSPAGNFGWLLKSDNESTTSAKRFASREAGADGPSLEVRATLPPPTNLEAWITSFFESGEAVDFSENLDGDPLVGLFEYGAGLDPKGFNPASDAFSHTLDGGDPARRLTFRFRRDPRADDLTYRVEAAGEDLVFDTVLAESTAGGVPTGPGLFSDHPIPDVPPFREVTVRDTVSTADAPIRFIRCVVEFTETP